MTAKNTGSPAEVIDQATASYFGAVKNALKVQEELVTGWLDLFRGKGEGSEFPPQAALQALKETIPLAERQSEELLKLIEEGSRRSLALMAEALEVRGAKPADTPARLQKLWENSLAALREHGEAAVRANGRVVEAWTGLAKRTAEGAAPPTTKAA